MLVNKSKEGPIMFNSVHNYYEQMVFERITLLMKERREEITEDLMEDIACITLNQLPPRYIRHNVDTAFNMTDAECEKINAKIIEAINNAMEFIQRRQTPH